MNGRVIGCCLGTLALAAACGSAVTGSTSGSALSAAYASATGASGTLLCAPSSGQIAACSRQSAGSACTLSNPDGGTGTAGTCRTTVDGTNVACAPNPPAPPQALVDACSGKTSGDACTAAEAFGDSFGGTCLAAPDGTTLVCGRQHTPPQAAIDACASLAAGDGCALPDRDGDDAGTRTGVCSLGPASTGPLACAPAETLLPRGVEACAGLDAGASCTMGRRDRDDVATGACLTPAAGGAAVCVVQCSDLGGGFRCGPGGHEHGGPGSGRR